MRDRSAPQPGPRPRPAPAERTSEPEFVDASRAGVVAGLIELFDQVNQGSGPQWVSLEAPSGWGKTRIAREFYVQLAKTRQTEPHYWPPTVFDSEAATDEVGIRRKRVAPQVTHVPGSLPDFAWWGITCSMRHGVASLALAQDLGQLQAHGRYLEDSWRRLRGRRDGLTSDLLDFGQTVIDEAGMELAGRAVEAALGSALPGLGLVRWLGEWSWSKVKDARERRHRLSAEEAIVEDHSDLVDEVADMFGKLASPGLPLVIFVEDAHDADSVLADLLSQLISSTAAVLIITTAWPGHFEDNEDLQLARKAARERFIAVRENSVSLPPPFPPGSGLGMLSADARAAILRHYYPGVDAQTAALLVERYGNPLALELFAQMPRYRSRFANGALRLSAVEVARLPTGVRDLYRALWNELPAHVRQALSVATLGIPSVLNAEVGRSTWWNQPLLLDALFQAGLEDAAAIQESLLEAPTAYAWARTVSEALRSFSEADQLVVAQEGRAEYLFEDEENELKNCLARRAADHLRRERPLSALDQDHLARLLLALDAEGFVDDADVLALATQTLLESLKELPRELPERLRLAEHALARCDRHSEAGRAIRSHYALALRQSDRITDAIAIGTNLVADRVELDGPEHPDTLADMHELGVAYSLSAGQYDPIPLHQEVLRLRGKVLGADHPDTLRTGQNLAIETEDSGRMLDALALYEQSYADHRRALGDDHRATLIAGNNLALAYGGVERHADALALAQDVLDRQIRSLGADHQDTMRSMGNVAVRLEAVGRVEEAISRFREIFALQRDRLGELHSETVASCARLANALAHNGRLDEAVELRMAQVDARMAAQVDPVLLAEARFQLAETLEMAGRMDEAMDLHAEVLTLRQELLGADHPTVIESRLALIAILRDLERVDQAVGYCEQLVADAQCSPGAQHPLTLKARLRLAELYSQTDRYEQAIAIYQEVIEIERTVRSHDVFAILLARSGLSATLSQAGRLDAAITEQEQVLQEWLAYLGAEYPIVVASRLDLAVLYRLAGRHTEAIAQCRSGVQTRVQHYPADSRYVIDARRELIRCLYAAGEMVEALEHALDLLSVCVSGRGWEDLATVGAGADVMRLSAIEQQWATTLEVGRKVVGFFAAVLPADNPDLVELQELLAQARQHSG